MKKAFLSLSIAITSALTLTLAARAQDGGGDKPEGGRRPEHRDPITTALDTNNDGVIDETELAAATESLKKLDKNGDGKLTQDELRANRLGREKGNQAGGKPDEMVNRLMRFDKNGDGKLSKDELPERLQSMIARGDTDKDGTLSKDELRKLLQAQAKASPARERGGEHDDDGDDD